MRRIATIAGVLIASLWVGPAARAATSVTFNCTAPATASPTPPGTPAPHQCTPAAGQAIDGTWTLQFTVRADTLSRLRRVRLFILSLDSAIPSPGQQNGYTPPVAVWGDPGTLEDWSNLTSAPSSRDLTYAWDTNVLTPYNGPYAIRVEAASHSESQPVVSERKPIKVDNPPATPAAPTATAGQQSIVVRWAPAREPDSISYTLYRARTASASTTPAAGAFTMLRKGLVVTQLADGVAEPGAYWYKIQSVRQSVVSQDGTIGSSPSASSKAVVVVAPPTPVPGASAVPGSPTPPAGTYTPQPLVAAPVRVQKPPPVPDAPFSAILPYDPEDIPEQAPEEPGQDGVPQVTESGNDGSGSRTAVLPVAVGAFLVSAAFALRRAP